MVVEHLDYKIILGILAALISVFSYIPYIIHTNLGKTKPHLFTWIIWSIMSCTAFAAQLSAGAAAGAWVNGATSVICLIIAIMAIKKGERTITIFDSACFALGLLAILLWYLTADPLLAVILVTIADALGYTITFVKAFKKPHEETISTFGFSALKHALSIAALSSYSLTTLLFPSYLVIYNTVYVTTIFLRRKYLAKRRI